MKHKIYLVLKQILFYIQQECHVRFNDEITAFIPSKYTIKEDGTKLKKGEEGDFVIIEFNKELKRVVASHSHIFNDKETKSTTNKKTKKKQAKSEKTKLGDIKELANLKEKLDGKD